MKDSAEPYSEFVIGGPRVFLYDKYGRKFGLMGEDALRVIEHGPPALLGDVGWLKIPWANRRGHTWVRSDEIFRVEVIEP